MSSPAGTAVAGVAFSAGARAAGAVICAGYLIGLVPGPVVAVVGGLALMTLGRGLLTSRRDEALAGAALAVVAGALGVAALRWSSLELSEIRAAQAVVGPTVLVAPDLAALASWLAGAGGAVALGIWLGSLHPRGPLEYLAWAGEAALGALALVTAFWGPKLTGEPLELGAWVLRVALVALLAAAVAELERRIDSVGPAWRWASIAVTAGAVGAGFILVAGAL